MFREYGIEVEVVPEYYTSESARYAEKYTKTVGFTEAYTYAGGMGGRLTLM